MTNDFVYTVSKGGKLSRSLEDIESLGGNFLKPVVISNANQDMVIMHEETFGPVAPVMSYRVTYYLWINILFLSKVECLRCRLHGHNRFLSCRRKVHVQQKDLKLANEMGVKIDARYGDVTKLDLAPVNQFNYTVNVFGHVLTEDKPGMLNNLIQPLVNHGHSYFEFYSKDQVSFGTGGRLIHYAYCLHVVQFQFFPDDESSLASEINMF